MVSKSQAIDAETAPLALSTPATHSINLTNYPSYLADKKTEHSTSLKKPTPLRYLASTIAYHIEAKSSRDPRLSPDDVPPRFLTALANTSETALKMRRGR